MKRIIMALIASAVALTFAACNEGTTVKWTAANDIGGELHDIKWMSGGQVDQQWSESLTYAADHTSSLGVTELAGTADAIIDDGDIATIQLSNTASEGIVSASGSNATLKEDAEVNLVITSAK